MKNKLPALFHERLEQIYNKADRDIIYAGYETLKRQPSFRINSLRALPEMVLDILAGQKCELEKIEMIPNCYILKNGLEKDLWDLDLFKAGKIYLQQITSQIPVHFLDLKEGNKVLDVTAAPWSKTSQIAELLKNTGEIIACDNNQIRFDKLEFTLKRQGVKNTTAIKTDARKIGDVLGDLYEKKWESRDDVFESFDNILFDAPCSAEGRINLNEEKTYAYWKPEIIKRNYAVQKEILQKILPLLKKGWTLVYSTCTLAPEENEAICHFILSNYPEMEIQDLPFTYKNARPGIKSFGKQIYRNEVQKSMRILPSDETEGFFVAKFKKK